MADNFGTNAMSMVRDDLDPSASASASANANANGSREEMESLLREHVVIAVERQHEQWIKGHDTAFDGIDSDNDNDIDEL